MTLTVIPVEAATIGPSLMCPLTYSVAARLTRETLHHLAVPSSLCGARTTP